jgi:hypothetical protein
MSDGRPRLRLVGKDDLDEAWDDGDSTDPLDDPAVPPLMVPKATRAKAARLPRTNEPFTRIFHSWLVNHVLFPPHIRLLVVLAYRSHEGRQKVRLTAKIAAEADIETRLKHRYARQLERMGAVHFEREGQQALTVTLLHEVRPDLLQGTT